MQERRYGVRRTALRSDLPVRYEVCRNGEFHDDGIVLQWRRRTLQSHRRLSGLLLLDVVFRAGRGRRHLSVRAGVQRVRHGQRVPVMTIDHDLAS